MKARLTLFMILLLQFYAFSQEQLGLRLENFAGVGSLSLNPAGNLSNPLNWDINLAGGGLFLNNNYGFIHNTNSFELIKRYKNASFKSATDVESSAPSNAFIIDFYNDNQKRNVNFSSFITGPSAVVKIKSRHSIGIFSNARMILSAQNLANEYSYYKYDDRPYFESFDVNPYSGAILSWAELGLNYALKVPTDNGSLGFGVNLKFLQAYEGAYFESLRTYEHTKIPGDSIWVKQLHGRFGYTSSNLRGDPFHLKKNGSGFAFDLGAVITFGEDETAYQLKLSAALLDLGYLKFGQNAFNHNVNSSSIAELALEDFEQFAKIEEFVDLVQLFSKRLLGDSLASESGSSFRLALPAALSLQGDYAFSEYFFLNAMLIQRLPTIDVTAPRENIFGLTPRFEHRWFSASAPFTLHNWQSIRMGFAVRLGFLIVGTDHLSGLVGHKDWNGADLYFALKINPFNLSFGKGKKGDSGVLKYGKKGKVKCYF